MIVAASVVAAEATDPAAVTSEIRRIALDPTSAFDVSDFTLRAGPARVVLSDGILVASTPVAGRPVEFVFMGLGRIELDPPDDIEAGQLELFTGSTRLRQPFRRAVFVIALDAAVDAIARRPTRPVGGAAADDANAMLESWLAGPERRWLDVEARVFADAVGDPLAAGFFCGSFEDSDLGRFLYVVDPLAHEQVTLGQFVRADLSKRAERRARRTIEKAQREGKLIGLEVADLGTWDTWVSTSFQSDDARSTPGSRGVEPDHYEIDAALRGRDLELEATARVSLRVVVDRLRTVELEMGSDLSPTAVTDSRGRSLGWFRSQNELVAVLAEPAEVGSRLDLTVAYTGRPLEKVASGAWVQRDTTGWYPHAGIIDRATYTVVLRWPERLDLVAPGNVEGDGADEDGTLWRRFSLDRPSMGYSFEVGRYETEVGRAGDVVVDVAVDRLGSQADSDLPREILATVIDVLEYYEEVFGPYPLDRLQVVSSPRGFSQGLLGFVTLSTTAVLDWEIWGAVLGIEDRRTVIAHELAHQWWGTLVGWRSYRDQWISEAVANYAALLWARNRLDMTGDDRLGWGPTANWQTELRRTTERGRPIESLGPLVVGTRLNSSISGSAYPAIVYKKGAVVLDMLSMTFRDGGFEEILAKIVEVASDRIISTEDFVRGIGLLGGTDLDWFLRRYVHGTGLPEVYYSYSTETRDNGGWAVVGTAEQHAPYHYRYRVVETASGGLDVRRIAEVRSGVANSVIVVPFQIGVAEDPESEDGGRRLLSGRVVIAGTSSPFRLEVEPEPEVFWLDREQRVFGRFFATDRWPRRTTYERGLVREAEGDPAGAREAFRQALGAEVAVVPPGWEDAFRGIDVEVEGDSLDARIRLALARLDLDAGMLEDARREIELADELVKGRDRWFLDEDLLAVESRLELLSGDPRSAFRRLKKDVLGSRGRDSRELWALLSIAAIGVGDAEIADLARDRAAELGVDMGPLVEY
jgi:hypothetical protein